MLLILLAQAALPSALMDLALQMDNAHLRMAALLLLHLDVHLVIALTLKLETAQSPSAQLMLQSSASTVSAPRATSSALLPSPMKMLKPALLIQMATSFLALMAAALAHLTSADLSFHAQVARLSAAMTDLAELSSLNALRPTAALLEEATDALVVFAPKTLATAHNLTVAQPSPAPSAHSPVIAPLTRLFVRQSTTPLSFQTTARPRTHTFAQPVTVLLARAAVQRFATAQMVNTSAQTRTADLSGDTTHSSQNLLKTTAWVPRTSAHQPASFAQT